MIITVQEVYTVKYVVSSDDYTQKQALQLIKDRKVEPIFSNFKELGGGWLARIRTIDMVFGWAYEFVHGTGKFDWVLRSSKEV